MRKNISPKAGLTGTATSFEVSDHRVISGVAAIAAVIADPDATPPVAARPAVPAVLGTVNSQIAFYDANGAQLVATRAELTAEQMASWDSSIIDDDAYFFSCHCARLSVSPL